MEPNIEAPPDSTADIDTVPPVSDSEESFLSSSDSSEWGDSDNEEPFDEPAPDRPYGDQRSIKDSLRLWAMETDQTPQAISLLLAILRQHHPEDNLPRDARSLLRKPVNRGQTVCRGYQLVQSITDCLQSCFRNYQPAVDSFDLDFFVDSLPLKDSNGTQLWQLLMKIHNLPDVPAMVISLFCGEMTPASVEEYLRPFVTEMNLLQENGLAIGPWIYPVQFNAFIADTTASSFVKGVVQPDSYHGCQRCTIVGERRGHRMCFRYQALREIRTDEQFRAGTYPGHIMYRTPIADLSNCDMILDVLGFEPKHLIDKGAQAKLLFLWIYGCTGMAKVLSNGQQRDVSAHWRSLKLPTDFRRKPRDLRYIKLWKAAEFQMFLMAGGPVVLKGILPDAAYQHFMLLFVAVTLLSSSRHTAKWEWADRLLHKFVEDYEEVYRPYLIDSNLHSLLHLYDAVGRFGELRGISEYPFEDKRHEVKKLMRSGRYTLAQAANRLRDVQQLQIATAPGSPAEYVSVRLQGTDCITKVRPGLFLRRNFHDQWFLTTTGQIVMYRGATKIVEKLTVHGYVFTLAVPAFTYPCSSTEIEIYCANMSDLNQRISATFLGDQILCKLAAVQFMNGMDVWFFPLPHTYLPSDP